jgi:hypothetical protein
MELEKRDGGLDHGSDRRMETKQIDGSEMNFRGRFHRFW